MKKVISIMALVFCALSINAQILANRRIRRLCQGKVW